jgi:anthraniloyl-CoA monooxygenase
MLFGVTAPRRVVSIGGGPAGLLAATLVKESAPRTEVEVLDRDPTDAAYGFGVVFSASSLGKLRASVPWLHDELVDAGRHWEDIELRLRGERVRLGGNGFASVGRTALLRALRRRAEAAGVVVRPEHEVTDVAQVDADLVLGADGIGSLVRASFAESFGLDVQTATARYVWFGAHADFTGLTFLFERTEHGWFAVHGYPYDAEGRCTFLVETDPDTWSAARPTDREPPRPGCSDEVARRYCAEVFGAHLHRPELLGNNSTWRNFVTLRTARWSHGRYVLLGDAAHTAHFSVGSGTTMALADAIALAAALGESEDVPTALRRYEAVRRPSVEQLQAASVPSLGWWENFRRYVGLPPPQFGMHFLARSGRVSHDRAARQDPEFVRRLDRWFSGGEGVDAVLGTPFSADGWGTSGRVVRISRAVPLGAAARQPLALQADALGPVRPDGVPALLIDTVAGPADVEPGIADALRAAEAGTMLIGVRAAADAASAQLAATHISERLRLEHGIATALVDDAGDRDHAAQLVLSGRADLIAVPEPDPTPGGAP